MATVDGWNKRKRKRHLSAGSPVTAWPEQQITAPVDLSVDLKCRLNCILPLSLHQSHRSCLLYGPDWNHQESGSGKSWGTGAAQSWLVTCPEVVGWKQSGRGSRGEQAGQAEAVHGGRAGDPAEVQGLSMSCTEQLYLGLGRVEQCMGVHTPPHVQGQGAQPWPCFLSGKKLPPPMVYTSAPLHFSGSCSFLSSISLSSPSSCFPPFFLSLRSSLRLLRELWGSQESPLPAGPGHRLLTSLGVPSRPESLPAVAVRECPGSCEAVGVGGPCHSEGPELAVGGRLGGPPFQETLLLPHVGTTNLAPSFSCLGT